MLITISQDRFDRELATFERTAFRLETRTAYKLGYEQTDFDLFLAGSPVPPPDLGWWRPWLEQIRRLTDEGKTVARVRVVDEPPSDYQRWELWAHRWHENAGEQINYLRKADANTIGLPLGVDWWLLDEARLMIIRYNEDGSILSEILTDDPGTIARHCALRDLAVRYATTAGAILAALPEDTSCNRLENG
jgi:hypothetical protein